MAVPCKLSENLHIFLVELLLYQRTCDIFLVTIIKMLVYVVLLQLINDLTLLLAILRPLVNFGPIGYKLHIIDKVDRILNIFCNR